MKEALVKPRSKPCRLITITPDLVLDLLKVSPDGQVVDGVTINCINGAIPESAIALRAGISDMGDICLLVQDDSFDEVFEGQPFPRLIPMYQESRPDD